MTTNLRKGYGRKGYWTGLEVEHTQFHGFKTLFLVPNHIEKLDELIQKIDELPGNAIKHVYIGFHESYAKHVEWFETICLRALTVGKLLTVEILPQYATLPVFKHLRWNYRNLFCMLIRVEVPELMVGGFAIKAIPSVAFGDNKEEAGVMTASFNTLNKSITLWDEYAKDEDGR